MKPLKGVLLATRGTQSANRATISGAEQCCSGSAGVYGECDRQFRFACHLASTTATVCTLSSGVVYASRCSLHKPSRLRRWASTSIQAASWISIIGKNLTNTTATWNGDFPKTPGGVSVTVDGKPGYLWYVSPTQINLQAPDDTATGTVSVVLTNGSGSFTSTATLVPISPSFSLLDSTHAAGVMVTPNGSGAYGGGTYDLVGPSGAFTFNTRPVKPGEVLELYGVGFGPTNPLVAAGQPFTGQAPTVYPVKITIGGVTADVSFAGMTEAGLYQFNLTVPNVGSGDQALQATVNGAQTQAGPVVTIQ